MKQRRARKVWKLALLVGLGLAGSVGQSSGQTLISIDRGWFRANGTTSSGNTNYEAGIQPAFPEGPLRNFFVFDLTSLSAAAIGGLTLQIFTNGYVSPDPSETFTIYDFTGSINDLTLGNTSVAVYGDLGSGTTFGSVAISAANNNTVINIPLNSAAVSAAKASAGARFAVGGALTTAPGTTEQRIFLDSHLYPADAVKLVVAVPEPSIAGLTLLGLVSLTFRRSRSRPVA